MTRCISWATHLLPQPSAQNCGAPIVAARPCTDSLGGLADPACSKITLEPFADIAASYSSVSLPPASTPGPSGSGKEERRRRGQARRDRQAAASAQAAKAARTIANLRSQLEETRVALHAANADRTDLLDRRDRAIIHCHRLTTKLASERARLGEELSACHAQTLSLSQDIALIHRRAVLAELSLSECRFRLQRALAASRRHALHRSEDLQWAEEHIRHLRARRDAYRFTSNAFASQLAASRAQVLLARRSTRRALAQLHSFRRAHPHTATPRDAVPQVDLHGPLRRGEPPVLQPRRRVVH